MDILNGGSDEAILQELGRRIAQSRLNQNKSQAALAEEAGVSSQTVYRVESGCSSQTSSLIRILRVLKLLGSLQPLIYEQAVSPVQQVKMLGKKRQRASRQSSKQETQTPWTWGDEE